MIIQRTTSEPLNQYGIPFWSTYLSRSELDPSFSRFIFGSGQSAELLLLSCWTLLLLLLTILLLLLLSELLLEELELLEPLLEDPLPFPPPPAEPPSSEQSFCTDIEFQPTSQGIAVLPTIGD